MKETLSAETKRRIALGLACMPPKRNRRRLRIDWVATGLIVSNITALIALIIIILE